MSGMLHMLTVLTIDKAHANTLNRWVREERERERDSEWERRGMYTKESSYTYLREREHC